MSDHSAIHAAAIDRVIYRAELPGLLHVTSETVRRWLRAGKLPKPDVDLSQRTRGWRLSTLHAAGIGIVDPVSPVLEKPAPLGQVGGPVVDGTDTAGPVG